MNRTPQKLTTHHFHLTTPGHIETDSFRLIPGSGGLLMLQHGRYIFRRRGIEIPGPAAGVFGFWWNGERSHSARDDARLFAGDRFQSFNPGEDNVWQYAEQVVQDGDESAGFFQSRYTF